MHRAVEIARHRHHPLLSQISLIRVCPRLSIYITVNMSLGKRQLNQLIGFLDKSGAVKDSLGGRENPAIRTVRAKREAEEAGAKHFLFHFLLPIIMILNIFRSGISERCSLVGNIAVTSHENTRRWLQGTNFASSASCLSYILFRVLRCSSRSLPQ